MRFRKNVSSLPGKPDIVFPAHKVAVFCDGDFWHGRNWRKDKARLSKGPNAPYWVAKIQANRDRDKRHVRELTKRGWTVIRFWDSDILQDPHRVANEILRLIKSKSTRPIKEET
jgi:DNA mismatch endonuclease (patch repair protein)